MVATVAAAESGARVMLVEEEHELGGHLSWGGESDLAALQKLRQELEAASGIEVLTDSVVTVVTTTTGWRSCSGDWRTWRSD